MKMKSDFPEGVIVYKISNLVNEKAYIGVTSNAKRRVQAHLSSAKRGVGHALHGAIRKYGKSNFTFEALHKCASMGEAFDIEIRLIKYFDTQISGYNITSGGDGIRNLTDESKNKLRASLSSALKGVPKSVEHVEAMRQSATGRIFSDDHRKAISKAKTGLTASSKTKQLMSLARKGRPIHERAKAALLAAIKKPKTGKARKNLSDAVINCRGRAVECIEYGLEFRCLTDASAWLKLNGFDKACPSAIGRVCRGLVPRAYGFTWRYALDVRDRQRKEPHQDSLEDGIAYSALKAEARLSEVSA